MCVCVRMCVYVPCICLRTDMYTYGSARSFFFFFFLHEFFPPPSPSFISNGRVSSYLADD